MGIAVFAFSLVIGTFHSQADAADAAPEMVLSNQPEQSADYAEADRSSPDEAGHSEYDPLPETTTVDTTGDDPYARLAGADSVEQLTRTLAELVAENPASASSVVVIALILIFDDSTLGDVASIAATATRAAPTEATMIASAVTSTLRDYSDPALAAAIASIVSLVPEQSRDIGLVVGSIVGDDVDALGMVAQTVAISVGEEIFSSLAEGSGVSMSEIMRESSRLGVRVPFNIPNYAAQLAPPKPMVADDIEEL